MKLVLRRSISIAQKIPGGSPYGEGYNYNVELTLPFTDDREHVLKIFKQVLSEVDHVSLGLDKDLGFEPTSGRLTEWLVEQLSLKLQISNLSLKLERGDGFTFFQHRGP